MCKSEIEAGERLREIPVIIVTSSFCQEEPPVFQDQIEEVGTRHLLSPPRIIKVENPWQMTNETPFGFVNK